MDTRARQLVRLAELLNVSARVLRDLTIGRDVDGESGHLSFLADELDRLSREVERIGLSSQPS